jgi:catechol-2,3-dioxygenase
MSPMADEMTKATSGPLTDAKLETVFLWVRDFKQMRAFYHETLGLPITYQNPHFADLRAGNCSIALHSEREVHTRSDSWHMEFLVNDIDVVVAELGRRGVEVARIRSESFGRITTFHDPEGNEIGIEEPPRQAR